MSYLTYDKLMQMGFKNIGKNIKISDKASIYNCEETSIGDNTRIDDFCVISGKIDLGRNVHIAPFCLMVGGILGIKMEDFSGLSYNVQVFTKSDDYSGMSLTNPTIPAHYKKVTEKRIEIGRHCIVGAGSIIFPGAHLAEGCSIGAMSLVRKSTQAWGIYVGNPAIRIKDRKKDLLDFEKSYLESGNDTFS